MSLMLEGDDRAPKRSRGVILRTSGSMPSEDGEPCVYLHLREVRGDNEMPLTFKVLRTVSVNALLARAGDCVTVEWIPCECRKHNDNETVACCTRFHLCRKVDPAYGCGFAEMKD